MSSQSHATEAGSAPEQVHSNRVSSDHVVTCDSSEDVVFAESV